MITLSALKRVPQTGKHWDEAEGVKRTVRALRRTRKQFYLTLGELDPILRYKLRKQYGRTQAQRRMLTNDWVAAVTRAAFQVHTNDRLLTAKIRAGILSSLPGVGIPVSSASSRWPNQRPMALSTC